MFDQEARNTLAEWDYRPPSGKGYGKGDVADQGTDNLSQLEWDRLTLNNSESPNDSRYPNSNVS